MFDYLKGRLKQFGLRQSDLVEPLGLNLSSISHRFTGRTAWSLEEMYTLMDICRADYRELHLYFPKSGKQVS